MKRMTISRRMLLIRACEAPIAGLAVFLVGCADKQPTMVCADPDQLSGANNGLRESLHYTERSSDANKQCSGCAYFRAAGSDGGCGTCEILRGPANPAGHCTSWSAKS